MKQVEFFFDVGSPYSYLAWHQLPKIAAKRGAGIIWRPVLLGAIFKASGNSSPISVPAKGRHGLLDLHRWARHYSAPFELNPSFPINTLPLMRGATAIQMREGDEALQRYLDAVFTAMFVRPRDLNQPQQIAETLAPLGIEAAVFMSMINDEAVKIRLRETTEEAIARGLFGVPTFFVGEQMFWGQDRLHFVDEALA